MGQKFVGDYQCSSTMVVCRFLSTIKKLGMPLLLFIILIKTRLWLARNDKGETNDNHIRRILTQTGQRYLA